ncbi:MAG: hypothetical protein ASARMPRED_008804 [Alectoria sarmentosa]|nr:MAG: hypothetical protein ASARMPRED_008804 [Alectoria sarmentosa]
MGDTTEPNVLSLLVQIDSLGKSLSPGSKQDADTRKKLRLAARDLSRAMEEPSDTAERVYFSVRNPFRLILFNLTRANAIANTDDLIRQFMEEAFIRIAIDLDVFRILVKSGKPQTLDDLIKATGADGVLLARLLRSLGAVGAVGEIGEAGEEAYIPTKVTRTFLIPRLAAGVKFCFDVLSPNWNKLPAFLKETHYRNPTDFMNAAFHKAHNTTLHFMNFLATRPDFQRSFHVYMSGLDQGQTDWLDFFPVEEEIGKGARQDPESIIFVDIRGGMGRECLALKKRYPRLPGRFINQDLPQFLSDQTLDGVESMAYNLFNPQPLKDAQVYYLRDILHNWNNRFCHKILENIRAAMDPSYSKVLINQWVVPTQRVSLLMIHQDFNMMATSSTMERTEQQTRELLNGAGLRIVKIWRPDDVERTQTIKPFIAEMIIFSELRDADKPTRKLSNEIRRLTSEASTRTASNSAEYVSPKGMTYGFSPLMMKPDKA